MSARLSDDGGEQQAAYCEHITAAVTCDPAELIVDTWLDEFEMANKSIMLKPGQGWHQQTGEFRLSSLRLQLLYLLRANTDELERAENAARIEGIANFSEWLEDSNGA